MRHLVFLLLLLALASLVSPAWGLNATYYVDPANGNDSWTGANPSGGGPNGPWKTINRVMSGSATPTVGPGDKVNFRGGTYAESQYLSGGGANSPSWGPGSPKGVSGNPITIQAAPGEFPKFQHGGTWNRFISFDNAGDVYVVIKGLEFLNNAVTMSVNIGNTNYVAIVECTTRFQKNGSPSTAFAHHIVTKNNKFYDIIPEHANYIAEQTTWYVHDGNYYERLSYFGLHGNANATYIPPEQSGALTDWIVRRNTYVNVTGGGTIMTDGLVPITRAYFYNNTFYNDQFMPQDDPHGISSDGSWAITFKNGTGRYAAPIIIKNNLTYGWFDQAPFYAMPAIVAANALTLDYNFWTNIEDAGRIYYWNGAYYGFTAFKGTTGQDQNGRSGEDPLFSDLAGRTFTLQPTSPAIDKGTPALTTTTSAALTPSTSLPVVDAGPFFDGWGLLDADLIQIGPPGPTNAPVLISSINYSTKVITLTAPRTWANGAAVGLAYNGTAPDMGAFESGVAASKRTVYVAQSGGSDANSCDGGITLPRQTTPGAASAWMCPARRSIFVPARMPGSTLRTVG